MIRFTLFCVIFAAFATVFATGLKNCVDQDARKYYCAEHQLCIAGICHCEPGFVDFNNECVKNSSNPKPKIPPSPTMEPIIENNSHLTAAIVIPIILVLVVVGSILVVRKYNLVSWVRNKMYQRGTPYDEVMIGQDEDDPPLSGV